VSKARKPAGRTPSQRQLRVGELVRHALSEILTRGEINDAELSRLVITVPEVRLSPDLKVATCYVMPLGGKDQDKVAKALARHAAFLRREVAHRVQLKYAPQLRFLLDETFAESDRITKLLHDPKVARDLAAPVEGGDGGSGGDE